MTLPYQRHQKTWDRYHNNPNQNRYKESDDYDALLSDAKNIPLWIESDSSEDSESHDKIRKECLKDRGNSTCCFWDLLGRPVKHNEEKPLFDYQQIILAALEYFLKIRIKKFRGGGMTELLLRYPAWLALSSNQFRDRNAFIITGITQELFKYVYDRSQDYMTYIILCKNLIFLQTCGLHDCNPCTI